MTDEQIARCRELHAARTPWKVIAREVGENINTAKYHVVHKCNPSTVEARRRAWANYSPKRRERLRRAREAQS